VGEVKVRQKRVKGGGKAAEPSVAQGVAEKGEAGKGGGGGREGCKRKPKNSTTRR